MSVHVPHHFHLSCEHRAHGRGGTAARLVLLWLMLLMFLLYSTWGYAALT